ncbi:MAG: PorP/SprF family type IX secretion system membrane protein [Bacteroidetes bacterium]|nr:PorP/SprF family type IX secretion system membrane protein [Bacteroidota bacterium]
MRPTLRSRQAMRQVKYQLVIAMLFCLARLTAQDIHFTQFFTNPLILSPASTGYFQGNYRLGVNYKYQWPWATNQQTFNYHTQAAYADFSLLENKVRHGWMGIGANFLNDDAGDGRLRYMRFGASVAWHQAFDRENRYVLSAGFVANYISKSVDFDKFYFNNQWVDDQGFDRSVPNYENPITTRISQIDLGAGLNFNAKVSDKLLLGTTFSMLHLNRAKDDFYGDPSQLSFRYIATLTAEYEINRTLSFTGNAYMTYQSKAYEVVAGGMIGYKPHDRYRHHISTSTIYVGAYYRVKDAASPIIGYQYKQTRLLVNYDIVTSKLAIPGKLNGGLEISLVHVGSFPHRRNQTKVACPKF